MFVVPMSSPKITRIFGFACARAGSARKPTQTAASTDNVSIVLFRMMSTPQGPLDLFNSQPLTARTQDAHHNNKWPAENCSRPDWVEMRNEADNQSARKPSAGARRMRSGSASIPPTHCEVGKQNRATDHQQIHIGTRRGK